jgi:glycosyltransferase involved in cell wall biosynthesis
MSSSERGLGVLILVPGELGEKLSGPEIRAVRLGQALAARHRVTLLAPGGGRDEYEGLAVAPLARRRLLAEARRGDVVLASTVPPFVLAAKRALGVRCISDQYDPVEVELGTLASGADRARATARAARRLQLRGADLVLCGGERQRALLAAEAAEVAPAAPPEIRIVPFGIDAPPGPTPTRDDLHPSGTDAPPPTLGIEAVPAGTDPAPRSTPGDLHPLRSRFPAIGPDDKVVLWWGSLWRWLDAETAIRAVASLAPERPDVKLVFTAGRVPNDAAARHSALAEARALAAALGALDRSVFFLDEWVPFARRADYLRDADLGLTLHRDAEEASLAARARYMDYLWAGLPCVLGRGDETADRFERAGFATLVEPGSPRAAAAAIVAALTSDTLRDAGASGRRLADELRWDRVAAPVLEALDEWEAGAPKRASPRRLRGTTAYYARRAADRLLPSG